MQRDDISAALIKDTLTSAKKLHSHLAADPAIHDATMLKVEEMNQKLFITVADQVLRLREVLPWPDTPDAKAKHKAILDLAKATGAVMNYDVQPPKWTGATAVVGGSLLKFASGVVLKATESLDVYGSANIKAKVEILQSALHECKQYAGGKLGGGSWFEGLTDEVTKELEVFNQHLKDLNEDDKIAKAVVAMIEVPPQSESISVASVLVTCKIAHPKSPG